MWGFAGLNDVIGNPFGNWFSRQRYDIWPELCEGVRQYLRQLTIDEREHYKEMNHVEWEVAGLTLQTEILIAGHLEDGPAILRLNHEVQSRSETPHSLDEPIFVGTSETSFLTTWRMLRNNAPKLDIFSVEGLRLFLHQSVSSVYGTEHPIDIWRLVNGEKPEYVPSSGTSV